MYLRTTTSRTKDEPVRYLQLAHNVRNRQTGSVAAQILYNFGRADQVDPAALERLVRSVQRFLDPEGVPGGAQAAALADGEFLSA